MSEERLNELFNIIDEGYPSIQEQEIRNYITYLQEANEILNNIINELENELYKFYAYEGYNDEQIKDKLQELKGSDKSE